MTALSVLALKLLEFVSQELDLRLDSEVAPGREQRLVQ